MLYLHWWFHPLGQWSRKFKFHLCWQINLIKQHALHILHNCILCRRKVAAGAGNPFVKMRVTAKLEKIFSSVLRVVWNRSEVRGTWGEEELQCLKIRNGNTWEKKIFLWKDCLKQVCWFMRFFYFFQQFVHSCTVISQGKNQLPPKLKVKMFISSSWKNWRRFSHMEICSGVPLWTLVN